MSNLTDPFVERRSPTAAPVAPSKERRQFTNSHMELSPEAQQLATAIDRYKLLHRRRIIDYEEMLAVVKSLGYRQVEAPVVEEPEVKAPFVKSVPNLG
jgi:hypothetical protein